MRRARRTARVAALAAALVATGACLIVKPDRPVPPGARATGPGGPPAPSAPRSPGAVSVPAAGSAAVVAVPAASPGQAGAAAARPGAVPADRPIERSDDNSRLAHADLLAKTRAGRIDVYFAGDSITRRWGATDYPELLAHWQRTFHGWNAANFAWGGDSTQNILWRLQNGELDGVTPKVFVLLAGTNNVGAIPEAERDAGDAEDIARGIGAIVRTMRERVPQATVILVGVLPRSDGAGTVALIDAINAHLAALADGRSVRFLDLRARFADDAGRLRAGLTGDGLHLNLAGYEAWAAALTPLLTELLGPPAADDSAPPPTGDPRAAGRVP